MEKQIATKFVNWDVPELKELIDTFPYQIREKINKGIKLNRDEKNKLYRDLYLNSYFNLSIPLRGWAFDFSDILKQFYVEDNYGYIRKTYAPDKTSIRTMRGSIHKITSIE